jgi:response regulator RpfG family c-di-GMP phosphodiesterase
MDKHVLFVDDEKNVLNSIKRMFFYAHYDITLASSGDEGLAVLAEKAAGVIVSDMRMPLMDGITFLRKTREVCPDAVRMVLSAHVDINEIMRAINDGHIWRYITKPWNENDLLLAVKNAFEFYDKNMETKRLIEDVKEKNRLLADVNHVLENRVRERTIQLEERNELLNMIVENKTTEEIVARACSAVSRQLSGRKTLVVAPQIVVAPDFGADAAHLSETSAKAIQEHRAIYEESAMAIPLHQKDQILGALVAETDPTIGVIQATEALESIASIVSIALSQKKLLQDMPGLLESINSIVEGKE